MFFFLELWAGRAEGGNEERRRGQGLPKCWEPHEQQEETTGKNEEGPKLEETQEEVNTSIDERDAQRMEEEEG